MRKRKINLTRESYEKLQKEYKFLTTTKRKEIALRFKEAFELEGFPDGSTVDEDLFIENRIRQINDILNRAGIIEQKEVKGDRIRIGSCVILKDLETQEEMEFVLVSSAESDLLKSKLSEESPVGKAIRGKRAGQVVRAKAPQGYIRYKVLGVGPKPRLSMPTVETQLAPGAI